MDGLAIALLGASTAVRLADAVGAAILLLFALWGLRRGAVRQALSLGLVVGAMALATALGPRAEATVAKVSGLTGDAREAAAWAAVLFATLVVGGVALSFLGARLPERAHGRADRLVGALCGGLKGLLVLIAVAYVAAAAGPDAAPPLSRTEAAPAPAAEAPSPWVARLRGSLSARIMATGGGWVAGALDLPAWIEARRVAVDRALATEAPAPRRPSPRGSSRPSRSP